MPKQRKSSKKTSCKVGEIKRASYTRKAHERKSYSRKTSSGKNTKIKSSHVSKTKVPRSCVPAKGKALSRGSKTPKREKVLPKIGTEISLTHYGYTTHKSVDARRKALRDASKDKGELKILKRLVLLRNYQADPNSKRIMGEDVKYLSIRHAKTLEKDGKVSHSVYLK